MKADAALVLQHQRQKLDPELKKRGVRLLPGGDYGFPFNPNGRIRARFVKDSSCAT